ncbi:flagellar assembly protein FliH [Nitrosomonas eutropha]|uniref:FliH/SctL family protein n=1 Tax=Nitrosomonas TaxID=914 RepID=UPI000898EAAE|nr:MULTISPECIES: flagellar assembly protein FliH [Nitrosomonas]MXS80816.1 flagellar assembly protein FliH [Nitrosomonas sp. GH22]SDW41794.1 flagellar assembly protein FliH [Nitrosomonas eutropha]
MEAAYVIPKKDLSSWQKWEFGSLDPLKSRQKTEFSQKIPQATKPVNQPEKQMISDQEVTGQDTIVLPTAEQIEQIYQQAHEEGKTAGYQEGMKQAKQTAAAEAQRFQALINTFAREVKDIDQAMAQDLLALAVDLARKITGQALQIKPELILPIVEDAIRQLTSVSQPIQLTLHPDDAARIRTHLEDHPAHPKWHIQEDAQIEPGGCRVESGGCEVDATLSTRWQRTLAALSQDPDWLT